MIGVDLPLDFPLDGKVLGLLEGRLDRVAKGVEGRWVRSSVLEALSQLINIRYLTGIVDTTALVVEAGEEGSRDLTSTIASLT